MAQQVKESTGKAAATGDVGQEDPPEEEMAVLKDSMDRGAPLQSVAKNLT